MKFIQKSLIILIIVFLFFSMYSNCFASFNDEQIPEEILSKIYDTEEYKTYNYHLMFFKHYSNYVIYFIEKDSDLKCYYSNQFSRVTKYGVVNENNRITFNKNVHLVVYRSDGLNSISKTYDTTDTFFLLNPYDHSYSNISIYNSNTYTDFFFNSPVPQGIVPALETVEELPKAITTTLMTIVPVGLIVFGTLLLVYIIRLLILRVT